MREKERKDTTDGKEIGIGRNCYEGCCRRLPARTAVAGASVSLQRCSTSQATVSQHAAAELLPPPPICSRNASIVSPSTMPSSSGVDCALMRLPSNTNRT